MYNHLYCVVPTYLVCVSAWSLQLCYRVFTLGIYAWTVSCITRKHQWGWFVLLQAYKLSQYFSPLPCSNWNTPPSNFWQQISHTVGCIPASKQAVDRFMLFVRLAQSSKFWQWISLPVLLALADYWLVGVRITSQVPLTWGQSQVINWIAHRGVQWVGWGTA